MSLEHSPARAQGTAPLEASDELNSSDVSFWNSFINERDAADFLGLSDRTLQAFRQDGGGPKFVRFSSRCIRYTRLRCKKWADERAANSTTEYP